MTQTWRRHSQLRSLLTKLNLSHSQNLVKSPSENHPKRILSFGGGVQTTALAILVAQGKVQVDAVVFADTGAEKPETYWYMKEYAIPLFSKAGIPFDWLFNSSKHFGTSLYDYLWRYQNIPHIQHRQCSQWFKRGVIDPWVKRHYGKDAIQLIGFSADELERSQKPIHEGKQFPLIELGLTGADCRQIIVDYGWPIPIKSSCYFCIFQRWTEWNWLKLHHPDLLQKAVELETNLYSRKPQLRHQIGLFGGLPLWKFADGSQYEFGFPEEYSCWEGHCGH